MDNQVLRAKSERGFSLLQRGAGRFGTPSRGAAATREPVPETSATGRDELIVRNVP
jgi:hypothetical protein